MMTTWVDFKAVKEAVSMEMALGHYGIRLRRISREYLRGACPLPAHLSRSSMQSFIVNTQRSIWSCQSTSCIAARDSRVGGNVLDFVALMNGCSIRDAAISLQRTFGATGNQGRLRRQERGHVIYSRGLPPLLEDATYTPLSFVLSGVDCRHPYLSERGINPDVARLFGVGHYTGQGIMTGRIVIPIHSPEGALVAYVGRSIDACEPRYRFPGGFRKSLFLFNLHRAAQETDCRTVVVVEGFFDCMKVRQTGYKSVVALMGSTLSERQAELLRQTFQEAVLMLDGDHVGRTAARTIAARLRGRLSVRVAHVPAGRQPDQLSLNEIQSVLRDTR